MRCSIIITGSPISIHQLSGDVDVLINQLNLNYIKHDNHVNVTRIKAASKNDPSVGVGNSGFRFDVALLLSWCSPSTLLLCNIKRATKPTATALEIRISVPSAPARPLPSGRAAVRKDALWVSCVTKWYARDSRRPLLQLSRIEVMFAVA